MVAAACVGVGRGVNEHTAPGETSEDPCSYLGDVFAHAAAETQSIGAIQHCEVAGDGTCDATNIEIHGKLRSVPFGFGRQEL